MTKMLLAIDIGNTTIALAAVHKGKVKTVQRMDTPPSGGNPRVLVLRLNKALAIFRKKGYILNKGILCSVVPKILTVVERTIVKSMGFEPEVVGRDVIVPIKNRYKNPKQVGQDRLVGAYAALRLYGKPLIVIDLGTAITFDVVSARGEYLGGAIVPGLRLSAESLFLKTALLPKIVLKAPGNIIGKTTEESILSGLFYGYGALCQGMVDLLSRRVGARSPRPHVVMTGGHTRLMKKFVSPKIRIIDENLVFKGMALLVSP
ncbi:MAG: type III pantothenate kinase [Candidatus Omnitrophota bacterium]|nr:type III pantothenate kinase [Candidatus Omnitrophota bacterium]